MERYPLTNDEKKQALIALTSLFLHKHYCENDTETLIAHLDETFSWFGAAEHEYAVGQETVANILRSFEGRVQKCELSDEHYDVIQISPDVFICSGRLWIATAPSSDAYLRVHQRITTVFRWKKDGPRCCHLHLSNPYAEMTNEDIGFPEKMSAESRKYFQEQIEKQKKLLEEQHILITQISFEDLSTGVFNRNKFNQVCQELKEKTLDRLGIAYFDLNGLKKTNDLFGHHAGDDLLLRTASHLRQAFGQKVYRIGGDEFIVIDDQSEEDIFRAHVSSAVNAMKEDDISISHGTSWRASGDIDEQINEADKNMYRAKQRFYANQENNRRRR